MPSRTGIAIGFVSKEGTSQDFYEVWLSGVVGEEVDTPVIGLVVNGEREIPVMVKWRLNRLGDRHYSVARETSYKQYAFLQS